VPVAAPVATTVLTESLIDRCGQRAAGYDRDNRFFSEDFEELRAARYLLLVHLVTIKCPISHCHG